MMCMSAALVAWALAMIEKVGGWSRVGALKLSSQFNQTGLLGGGGGDDAK